jgi:hypothetical protein
MNVYEKAAQLIEECGWFQGTAVGPGGELCMLGAIDSAGELVGDGGPGLSRIYADLGLTNVANWNDAPDRTKAEVLAKLREAVSRTVTDS